MLWRRWGGEQALQQARQDGFHVEAAIEAELELGEIAVRVLGEVEGVVGAGGVGETTQGTRRLVMFCVIGEVVVPRSTTTPSCVLGIGVGMTHRGFGSGYCGKTPTGIHGCRLRPSMRSSPGASERPLGEVVLTCAAPIPAAGQRRLSEVCRRCATGHGATLMA